jgi:hypothetical protein
MDKRIRAAQRKAIVEELEAAKLTFTPTINRNSVRIVSRLNREREERERLAALGLGAPEPSPAGATARSARKALGATAGSDGASAAAAQRPLGRSFLPGHEEETFQPRINPRSHTLHRPGIDDKDVYSRLYDLGRTGAGAGAGTGTGHSPRRSGGERPATAPASSASDGEDGEREPQPGEPRYFNAVAYAGTQHDFIVRRLLSGAAATAASGRE